MTNTLVYITTLMLSKSLLLLKGEANIWYRWKRTRVIVTTWIEFCNLIRARFNPEKFVDARLAISTIEQKGTVHQHISEFEKLLNFVEFPEDYLISCFVRSLKPHIGYVVKLFAPHTLDEAYTKEIHQEEAYAAIRIVLKQPYRPPPFRQPIALPQAQRQHILPSGYRRLSPEEQRERRTKGMCFKYDQPYRPNHVCVNPQLTVLDIEEPTKEITKQAADSISATDIDDSVEDDSPVEVAPTISLNSLMGSPFPTTMRITGSSKAQPITILVDSGSTHNFLSPSFAKQCGYPIHSKDTSLRVTIGDGGHIHTQGTCLHIPIQLQNHMFTIDLHVLDVSGCDVVLGVQWLHKLGHIEWDFEKFVMKFTYSGADIQLLVHNSALTAPLIENPAIRKLMSTFQDVFETPTSLPPAKLHDHRIPLIPDSSPVNVRPYRYPHFQKDEIEKIISELKQAVYSSKMQDHIKHLTLVFEILRKHQLFVKESKCTFAQPSVGYLGHVISSEGVAVEQEKIDSVLFYPIPSTVKSLRGFLGLAGYYRKFVKNFGKICAPLIQLLKKDAFLWTDEATSAFRALQHVLTTTPVLMLPDFTKEFYLECDASGTGLGVV
ncbi:uncharacterized protein LOC113352415 [Papaver somniferum]|uniref:uncharacterized protein LOC113352415 n=1 Tax=Papaver somniferum TaxID=3469 RepID=UPI000E6F5934|nr:uncharacterized protein LOC113352415 [Papaver somniferum]